MKAFKIKTHRLGETYSSPHFFVLSKGNNAGKPSCSAFTNSFVIMAHSESEAQQLFWTCNILFTGHYFKTRLCGSVIPFIRIGEVQLLLEKMVKNYQGHHWNGRFQALEKLEQITKILQHQHRCINQYKIALMQSYDLDRE